MEQLNFRILGICIKGFKGFKEEVIIKFASIQTLIEGKNAEGKTTIGDAISWSLYGNDINNSDKDSELVNDQSEEMYVTVEIEIDGKVLRIARIKKNTVTLKLNGRRITQKALNDYLPSKKLFMTIFNPNIFLTSSSSKAREQLLSILPKSNPEEILTKNNCIEKLEFINKYPNTNVGIQNITKQITATKNSINVTIGEKNTLDNLLSESKLKIIIPTPVNIKTEKRINELEKQLSTLNNSKPVLKDKQEIAMIIRETELAIAIEQNKYYINSSLDTINTMESEVANFKGQYTVMTSSLDELYSRGPICNECGQTIDDKFKFLQETNIKSQMCKIENIVTQYNESIELMKSIDKDGQNEFEKNKEKIITSLKKTKINHSGELNNIENINRTVTEDHSLKSMASKDKILAELNTFRLLRDKYKEEVIERDISIKNVDLYSRKLKNVIEEKNRLSNKLTELEIEKLSLSEYNTMYVKYMTDILTSWLIDVTIELYKVNNGTGELKEDFRVLYQGKNYNRLSNSERIRVGLEISNMFNMALGIEYPVFIDNAESIIDLPIINTQMIIAKVANKDMETVEFLGHVVESPVELVEETQFIEEQDPVVNEIVVDYINGSAMQQQSFIS